MGLTGACKLRNPGKIVSGQLHRRSFFFITGSTGVPLCLTSLQSLHRRMYFLHRRFNRSKTLASASGSIAPTPSLCSSSVHPVHAAALVFSEPIAPMSVICLAPVQPVIANYLCLCPFDLISSGFCIFSSLGPINLIMIILTHILVQVLCVSSIAKTLY